MMMKRKIQPILKFSLLFAAILGFGYFARAPRPNTFSTFQQASEPVIYSKQCNDNPLKVLAEAISSANKSLFLRIYNLSAPELLSPFIEQAKSGKSVTIHYQMLKDKELFPSSPQVSLVEHPREGRKLMHQKALAIDDAYAWLGSANYTHESLLFDSNLIIGCKSPELCDFIKNQASGSCVIQGQQAEYFSILGDNKNALEALLNTLRSAKKTIQVAMFALSDRSVIQELDAAQKRGIQVDILVDQGFSQFCIKQIQAIKDSHLSVYEKVTPNKLHHKLGIIDANIMITGSVNWSTDGFALNTEDMIILHDLTPSQLSKLNCIWNNLRKQCKLVYSGSEHTTNESQEDLAA